jgi:hypothetical protein
VGSVETEETMEKMGTLERSAYLEAYLGAPERKLSEAAAGAKASLFFPLSLF